MTTLFLDFASHRKSIALVRDAATVALVAVDDHAKEAELLPAVDAMLKTSGVSLGDLRRIAATVGPGGFMSLRVGLSLANALSWSLKIPVGGIHLSDLWRVRLPAGADVLWLHSTKKNLLFARGFGALEGRIPGPVPMTLDDLKAEIVESADFVGELIPEHGKALPVTMAEGVLPLERALPTAVGAMTYAEPPLLPWYGRGI